MKKSKKVFGISVNLLLIIGVILLIGLGTYGIISLTSPASQLSVGNYDTPAKCEERRTSKLSIYTVVNPCITFDNALLQCITTQAIAEGIPTQSDIVLWNERDIGDQFLLYYDDIDACLVTDSNTQDEVTAIKVFQTCVDRQLNTQTTVDCNNLRCFSDSDCAEGVSCGENNICTGGTGGGGNDLTYLWIALAALAVISIVTFIIWRKVRK